MGYHKAGFEVIGIDIDPQPRYPFVYLQADVGKFRPTDYVLNADLIHASPPCQGYSKSVTSIDSKWVPTKGKLEPRLIDITRELMVDRPYVIENVMGAKSFLRNPVLLCGSMFGLAIPRHRLFEANWPLEVPEHPKCKGMASKYAKEHDIEYRDMSVTGKGRHQGTSDRWKTFMGIDWQMSQSELVEAIPPAYTEYIGRQFIGQG